MNKLLLAGPRTIRDFGRDVEGSTALTFGLGLTVMLIAMGTGLDFAMASQKQAKAQSLADQVGLAAAVYIKNSDSGVAPQNDEDGLRDGVVYKASDLGKKDFVIGDTDAEVVVDYGVEDATVTVSGTMPTTFMSLAGIKETDYSAQAVIKYEKTGIRASSVMLILDNSGSMSWDDLSSFRNSDGEWQRPEGVQSRIDGLRTATNSLLGQMSTLKETVDLNEYVRMGMIPYSGDILSTNRVMMRWGLIKDSEVAAMTPDGATNSSPPMTAAMVELKTEQDKHAAKGNTNPLKFAIFMTDGQNTVNNQKTWTPEKGTGLYRTTACFGEYGCYKFYDTTKDAENDPPEHGYENHWAFESQTPWEEGTLRSTDDTTTLQECEALKADGVYVYAIGFAVNPGNYYDPDNEFRRNISEVDSNRIYSFLEDCSSGPGYFMAASNSTSLDAVFKQIGQTIHERSIYVSR